MIDYINYVILIYVLGIIGIVINVYAFFKRDDEYTARLLGPNQTLTTIDTYLESSDGVEMMTDFINQYKDNLNFLSEDRQVYILTEDKSKILEDDEKNGIISKSSKGTLFSFKKV